MKDYLETASKYEDAFRAILQRTGRFEQIDLSLELIFAIYSTGDRKNTITIVDFQEKGPDKFALSWEIMGSSMGHGYMDLWTFTNNEATFVQTLQFWIIGYPLTNNGSH